MHNCHGISLTAQMARHCDLRVPVVSARGDMNINYLRSHHRRLLGWSVGEAGKVGSIGAPAPSVPSLGASTVPCSWLVMADDVP